MNVLDLFSGIGGFSLGLERAGMRTVAFCEIEPYCRAVLKKHWPDVPVFADVSELSAWNLSGHCIYPDVICGGFPCQDISIAGQGAGLDGKRSGLWNDFVRLIREIRPLYAIVENSAALSFRGLHRILGDLAEIGFDAEWHCIPASAVGAPHERDRIWIIANDNTVGLEAPRPILTPDRINNRDSWPAEPAVGRVVHGLSGRVDRIMALGNAVVPQIPELIGRAIMQAEGLA